MSALGFSLADDQAAAHMGLSWFRPLLALSYEFNRHVGYWVTTNVLIHLVCAITVALIAGVLGYRRWAAGGLFLLSPLAADAVWSVAGRSSELCAMFMLLALYAGLKERWKLCALGFVAACLTKEEAVVFPLLMMCVLWMRGRLTVKPFTACVLGFLAVPVVHLPPARTLAAHVPLYLSSLGNFLMLRQTGDPHWTASLNFGLVTCLALGAIWRKKSIPAAMILLSPLAAYLFFPLADPFLEHRAYFALAGMAILLAQSRLWPLFAAAYCVLSFARMQTYSDPIKLWTEAVRYAPAEYRPWNNLADAYGAMGQGDLAIFCSANAYKLNPTMPALKNAYAFHLVNAGHFSEAMEILHPAKDEKMMYVNDWERKLGER